VACRHQAASVRIRVRGYLTLRDVVGDRVLDLAGPGAWTVRELIRHLSDELGDDWAGRLSASHDRRDLARPVIILVNGRHCTHLPDGLDTPLADGDEVAIFPPVAGG
jgi:MoaD family protein